MTALGMPLRRFACALDGGKEAQLCAGVALRLCAGWGGFLAGASFGAAVWEVGVWAGSGGVVSGVVCGLVRGVALRLRACLGGGALLFLVA